MWGNINDDHAAWSIQARFGGVAHQRLIHGGEKPSGHDSIAVPILAGPGYYAAHRTTLLL
jgi:hypothetical protein